MAANPREENGEKADEGGNGDGVDDGDDDEDDAGGESHEGQKGLRSADDDGWAMAQEEAADCPSDPPAAFGQRSGDNDHWVQHKDNDNVFAP